MSTVVQGMSLVDGLVDNVCEDQHGYGKHDAQDHSCCRPPHDSNFYLPRTIFVKKNEDGWYSIYAPSITLLVLVLESS